MLLFQSIIQPFILRAPSAKNVTCCYPTFLTGDGVIILKQKVTGTNLYRSIGSKNIMNGLVPFSRSSQP